MKWIERFLIALGFMIFIGGTAVSIATSEDKDPGPVPVAVLENGKVNMYRFYDKETGVVCYPLVGHLHGKTVAQDCVDVGWRQLK